VYLSRRYVVAFLLAIVALAAYVVVPRVASSIHDQEAHDALVAADAAFSHLKVPKDFAVLRSDTNCDWYPCYRVPLNSARVKQAIPAILKTTGAQPERPLNKQCPAGLHSVNANCAYYGLSHGYQVLVLLGPETSSCVLKPHRPARCADSIVQITAPYIPEAAQPDSGGSGWPLSSRS
jgi:hypothetical protein